jgi:hypothetical protein
MFPLLRREDQAPIGTDPKSTGLVLCSAVTSCVSNVHPMVVPVVNISVVLWYIQPPVIPVAPDPESTIPGFSQIALMALSPMLVVSLSLCW